MIKPGFAVRYRIRMVSLLRIMNVIVIAVFIAGSGSFIMLAVVTSFRQNLVEKNAMLADSISHEVEDYLSGSVVSLSLLTHGFYRDPVSLELFGATFTAFEGIIVLDRTGRVVSGIGEAAGAGGFDYSNRDVFTIPVRTKKNYISPSWISERTYEPGVSIAIPFGAGVIVGRLSLGALGGIVRKLSIGPGDDIAVADSNGYFIAHSDPERVRQRENVTLYGLPVSGEGRRQAASASILLGGREYLMNTNSVAGTDWTVISAQSGEYLFRPMRLAVWGILAAIVLASAASFAAVSAVLRYVERDIGCLVAHTGAVADGDYSLGTITSSFGEFHALSVNFSKMIEAVKQREAALVDAGEKIKENLGEKEIMLREIHHRVKNNMQLISSLLSLQSETLSDPDALFAFGESMNRIKAMSVVHEMLYESDNLALVDMEAYAKTLATSISASFAERADGVRFVFDLDPVSLSVDDAIPCGLILNELLSNSLKYAFPEKYADRLISLAFKRDGDAVTFRVDDNGCGMSPGFDPEIARTLGMRVILSLCSQLRGTWDFSGIGGTSWTVTFRPGSQAAFKRSAGKSA